MSRPPSEVGTNPLDAKDNSRREQRLQRGAWHRKASKPVTIWIGLLLVLSLFHWAIPDYRWLFIHIFTLGIVTNSIMLWSQHFTEKFLHQTLGEETRPAQLRRFLILNAGIVLTLVGQLLKPAWSLHWIVTCIGAAVVGLSLAYHAWYLGWQWRASKSKEKQRFDNAVLAYIFSASCLPFGAIIGSLLASEPGAPWPERLRLAHLAFNVLGFVGFAAVGSLALLFATIWRTQIKSEKLGLVIGLMALGIVVIVSGSLLALMHLVATGIVLYTAGIVVAFVGWARSALEVAKDPRDRITFAAVSVLAAPMWLIGSLIVLAVRTFQAGDVSDFNIPTMALVVGFVAQLLTGVMSYLLPSNIGGGPGAVRTGLLVFDRAGLFRATLVNLGLALWLSTEDSILRVVASILAMGSLAVFFFLSPLAVRAQLGVIRKLREPIEAPAKPKFGQVTAALSVLALIMAASGMQDSQPAPSTVSATGETTIQVAAVGHMAFEPAQLSVPRGHNVVVEFNNADTQAHDLKFDNGAHSGRVQPGETVRFELGTVTTDLEGWCTIAGHRQQGMVMHLHVEGDGPTPSAAAGHGEHTSVGNSTVAAAEDLNQANFIDPVLAPATGTVHEVTLDVSERDFDITPQMTRGRWTFNGQIQGPVLRGKVGDTFDITLVNNGTITHSIDFHAGMVSPDAVMRDIAPGESLNYRFQARNAGIWMYHCGTKPVSMHIASGMFGAVIIDPPNLPQVDQEYVLIQSEVYGLNTDREHPVDEAALAAGTPQAVVFNGIENQYVAKPLHLQAGQTARFWVLNAGPNLSTSFHIVGTQFHTSYKEGAYLLRDGNGQQGGSQALDLLAAQGGFVEATFLEPGTYTMVNHQFIDAERGALGKIVVE